MELIKFICLFLLFWLRCLLSLNKVHIMLLESHRHWVLLVSALVLYSCDLVVPDKLGVLFLGDAKLMVVQSTLVCYLLRDELSVVPCGDALVNHFFLLRAIQKIRVYKLCHLDVVCEDVQRHILPFSNRNELISLIIFSVGFALCHEKFIIFSERASLEGGDWIQNPLQLLIEVKPSDLETTVLPIEELAKVEGVSV